MNKIYKIETFVPVEALENIKAALYEKGFGKIGNYENCLSWHKVESSWKPVGGANPYQGTVGETEFATEYKIEFRCDENDLNLVVDLIKKNHPYEEVCINVIPIIVI